MVWFFVKSTLKKSGETPIRKCMKNHKWRHFLFGFLFGAGGLYFYTFYGEQYLNLGLNWMQRESDRYQAENPTPKADSGWGNGKGGHK